MFTTLTFVVTMVHLDKFHLGAEHPTSARIVTSGWLAIYAGVPVAMIAVLALQSRVAATVPGGVRHPLPAPLRWSLLGLGVVLAASGAALLLDPEWAAQAWSWPLTPLTGRAVGGPSTSLGLDVMKNRQKNHDAFGYTAYTSDGRELRCSSVYFHNAAGDVIASLCVNVDLSPLQQVRSTLEALLPAVPAAADAPREHFGADLVSVMDSMISFIKRSKAVCQW